MGEPQFQSSAAAALIPPPDRRRLEALGDLRVLPDETLFAILTYLSPHDIGRLSCVSRFIIFPPILSSHAYYYASILFNQFSLEVYYCLDRIFAIGLCFCFPMVFRARKSLD